MQNSEKQQANKENNTLLVLKSLSGLAVLCVTVSAAVLYLNPESAKEIYITTFAPVSIIVAGLLGFIKS